MKGHITPSCHLTKDDLEKFKVAECPQCQHLTLQVQVREDHWHTCLNCGNVLELKWATKK